MFKRFLVDKLTLNLYNLFDERSEMMDLGNNIQIFRKKLRLSQENLVKQLELQGKLYLIGNVIQLCLMHIN